MFISSNTLWDIWAILQPQAYRLHGLQPQHTLLLLDFFVAVKKSRRNTDHSDLKSDRRQFFVKTLRTRAESDYQIINFSQSVAQTDFTALIGVKAMRKNVFSVNWLTSRF